VIVQGIRIDRNRKEIELRQMKVNPEMNTCRITEDYALNTTHEHIENT
jgi:hypothetical protein